MNVVDHQPGGWFLLEDAGQHYIDVNCSQSAVGFSLLLRLDDDENAKLRARGRAFADEFAEEVSYRSSRYQSRAIQGAVAAKAHVAIDRWLRPGEPEPEAISPPSEEVLRKFRIGPQDLAANRQGRLGAGQIRRMRRNLAFNVGALLPVQAVIVGLVAVAPRRPFLLYAMAGVFVAALLAIQISYAIPILRGIRSGVVRCLTGPAAVQHAGKAGNWLVVQGERNRLLNGYPQIVRGRSYHVYVSPAARVVVAME
jgi:hypothetical protein